MLSPVLDLDRFNRFCQEKGLRGKQKKRFRKYLMERALKQASAANALVAEKKDA